MSFLARLRDSMRISIYLIWIVKAVSNWMVKIMVTNQANQSAAPGMSMVMILMIWSLVFPEPVQMAKEMLVPATSSLVVLM